MKVHLTKAFFFSASFSQNNRVVAHNYTLKITTDGLDERLEKELEAKVEGGLIKKLQSHDLGTDVDFLKGTSLEEESLLKVFWALIQKEIHPVPLRALSLEKDGRSKLTLSEGP